MAENKYIIGYTAIEYNIKGILIPKKVYSEFELSRGKKRYTVVTAAQLKELKSVKLFNNLLDIKAIRVLDHLPGNAMSDEEKIITQKTKLADKDKEIARLKAKLKAAGLSDDDVDNADDNPENKGE